MFADENTFFSPSVGTSDFHLSEPRKSLGGMGAPLASPPGGPPFGVADDLGGPPEPFSQDVNASQRVGAPAGGPPQTPDGCVCCTVGMLRRAVRSRTAGGPLQIHERDVGLVGLCGISSALEIRASLFKFTLEDTTGKIEIECSNKGALAALKEDRSSSEADPSSPSSSSSSSSSSRGLSGALEGGLVTVYGFPCTDDKGEVYIDCLKASEVSDPREYVELFPLRILAGALQGPLGKETLKHEKAAAATLTGAVKEETDEAALQVYEHITDAAQRAVLRVLLAAKGQAIKRQEISSSVSGFAAPAIEAALNELEEAGEVALTSTWVTLAS